uniref:Uncharacterized protein n=1 Tax=Halimeda micronesica TaxID=170426 RepID=A0A386AXE3_9CHLO|nr:hypothetical protein [Halimeda micronesica]
MFISQLKKKNLYGIEYYFPEWNNCNGFCFKETEFVGILVSSDPFQILNLDIKTQNEVSYLFGEIKNRLSTIYEKDPLGTTVMLSKPAIANKLKRYIRYLSQRENVSRYTQNELVHFQEIRYFLYDQFKY